LTLECQSSGLWSTGPELTTKADHNRIRHKPILAAHAVAASPGERRYPAMCTNLASRGQIRPRMTRPPPYALAVSFPDLGDVPTWGLFAGAVVTSVYAILAFRKQSEEVRTLEQQAVDQQELIKQQSELLKVQAERLDLEREQLEHQRLAPRLAGWETAVRDLSLFLGRERRAIWSASAFFPVESDEKDPPELMPLIDSRDALRDIYMALLGMLGVLPSEIAKKVLPVAIELVEAENEITALVLAMAEAMEAQRSKGQATWQWADAERVHLASKDPERAQPWVKVAAGRHVKAAEGRWEELDDGVQDYLHTLGSDIGDRSRAAD